MEPQATSGVGMNGERDLSYLRDATQELDAWPSRSVGLLGVQGRRLAPAGRWGRVSRLRRFAAGCAAIACCAAAVGCGSSEPEVIEEETAIAAKGESIAFQSDDRSVDLRFTLVELEDPLRGEADEPDVEDRAVGVHVRISNRSRDSVDAPSSSTLTTSDGQSVLNETATGGRCADRSPSLVRLRPGASTVVCFAFVVPRRDEASTIEIDPPLLDEPMVTVSPPVLAVG